MSSLFTKKRGSKSESKRSARGSTSSSSNSDWKRATDGLGFLQTGKSHYQKLTEELNKNHPGYELWYKGNGEATISRGKPKIDGDSSLGQAVFDPSDGNNKSKWDMLLSCAKPAGSETDDSYAADWDAAYKQRRG